MVRLKQDKYTHKIWNNKIIIKYIDEFIEKFKEQETKEAAIDYAEKYDYLFEDENDYLLIDVHSNNFDDFEDFETYCRVITDSDKSCTDYLYKVIKDKEGKFDVKMLGYDGTIGETFLNLT